MFLWVRAQTEGSELLKIELIRKRVSSINETAGQHIGPALLYSEAPLTWIKMSDAPKHSDSLSAAENYSHNKEVS
jgi:hypothetical protein